MRTANIVGDSGTVADCELEHKYSALFAPYLSEGRVNPTKFAGALMLADCHGAYL